MLQIRQVQFSQDHEIPESNSPEVVRRRGDVISIPLKNVTMAEFCGQVYADNIVIMVQDKFHGILKGKLNYNQRLTVNGFEESDFESVNPKQSWSTLW